jgi:hypothetical protein
VHVPEPLKDDASASESLPPAVAETAPETPIAARPRRLEPPAKPPADAPKPIGMDRLRALREAIRNGTYPTQTDVVGGLVRMLGEPDADSDAEEDEVP